MSAHDFRNFYSERKTRNVSNSPRKPKPIDTCYEVKQDRSKYRYFIGIDPDIYASGVAVWDSHKQDFTTLYSRSFGSVVQLLLECKDKDDTLVTIDAGWLNQSNFHAKANQSHRVSAHIGESVGANHQTGKLISELCKEWGIDCEWHRPTKSKIDADQFKKYTGYTKRINQDCRDAAMLVYGQNQRFEHLKK